MGNSESRANEEEPPVQSAHQHGLDARATHDRPRVLDRPQSRDADVLLGQAMQEIAAASRDGGVMTSVVAQEHESKSRFLERVIDRWIGTTLAGVWQRWCRYCAVDAARLPYEDELFSVQRELRRAHALIAALQQSQIATTSATNSAAAPDSASPATLLVSAPPSAPPSAPASLASSPADESSVLTTRRASVTALSEALVQARKADAAEEQPHSQQQPSPPRPPPPADDEVQPSPARLQQAAAAGAASDVASDTAAHEAAHEAAHAAAQEADDVAATCSGNVATDNGGGAIDSGGVATDSSGVVIGSSGVAESHVAAWGGELSEGQTVRVSRAGDPRTRL